MLLALLQMARTTCATATDDHAPRGARDGASGEAGSAERAEPMEMDPPSTPSTPVAAGAAAAPSRDQAAAIAHEFRSRRMAIVHAALGCLAPAASAAVGAGGRVPAVAARSAGGAVAAEAALAAGTAITIGA
jgi:hypothetical protein